LRADIVAGRWKPGALLREQELAALLGMSRTPVREAVRRLQADHFLVASRSGGVSVPDRGTHELIGDYLVRAELEALAAELGTELIADEQIDQMETLTESAFDYVHSQDMDRYIAANHSFHRLLVQTSGNVRLAGLHALLSDAILMASGQEAIVQSTQALINALYGHYEITNAMRHRQPERARKAARNHVLESVVWLRKHEADKRDTKDETT
jgi:DNA-binding GntR family transcriptional regulator